MCYVIKGPTENPGCVRKENVLVDFVVLAEVVEEGEELFEDELEALLENLVLASLVVELV